MDIVDVQVHVFERDHPGRPWAAEGMHGPREVTGEQMVAAMDEAKVDAAIIVSPWSVYRWDPSYSVDVAAAYPERFRVVTPVDATQANVRETVDELSQEPTIAGLRLMIASEADAADVREGRMRPFLDAVAANSLPLCIFSRDMSLIAKLAGEHPQVQLVVDHLGLVQPFEFPPGPEPFQRLPEVLALAAHDNVAIKVSGVPTLSLLPYPYSDLWPHLHAVFDSFGLDRCMWGTDWTRALSILSYEQGVSYILESDELSSSDKATLFGATLRRIYRWNP